MSHWVIPVGLGLAVVISLLIAGEYLSRLHFRYMRPFVHPPEQLLEIPILEKAFPGLPRRTIRYKTNCDGERAEDPPAGERVFRILVAGGSAAECRLLDQSCCWSARLQALLNVPDVLKRLGASTVHVGLVAQSQLDTTGLLEQMKLVLPHYPKLDMIFYMTGFSDVLRWLECGAVAGQIPKPVPLDALVANHRNMAFTWRRSAIRLLYQRWVGRGNVQRTVPVGYGSMREAEARRSVKEFAPLPADRGAVLKRLDQNLNSLIDLGNAHAQRVVLLRQPWFEKDQYTPEEEACLWSGRVGHPKSPGPPGFVSHRDLIALVRDVDECVVRVAGERSIAQYGMRHVLENRLGIYCDHFHLAEEGAIRLAEEIKVRFLEMIPDGPDEQ